jgi:hypothetical protein
MAVSSFWYAYALAKAFGSTQSAGTPAFDWLSDTIKVALLSSAYTPSQDTHTFFSDVDSREITGSGYTAGGATLSGKTLTETDGMAVFDAVDTSWPTSAITARYAVIYKMGTAANSSPLLGYMDFGVTGISHGGTFTITWPVDGIFSIVPESLGVIYRVNAVYGNDANDGHSFGQEWQTITKVNAALLAAGDQVLFNQGDTFPGKLMPALAGIIGRTIVFGAYGSGARPIIDGSAQTFRFIWKILLIII